MTVTKLCISWCQNFICHAMSSHTRMQWLQSTLMQLWSCANKLTHFCKGILKHTEYIAFMTANSKHPAAQSEHNGKPWAALSAVSFLQHKFYFRFAVLTPVNNSHHDTDKKGTNENNSLDILSDSNGEKMFIYT